MNIAIIGTRGIPNHYGGFEQFADILSQGLVKKGHKVTVYCSKSHNYKESTYNGVQLIHKFDPENRIGTIGQFIYDFLCMMDANKKDFDIIYMLGYTSSSIWKKLIYNKGAIIISNMDGLEWKRSKYSPKVRRFLKFAEQLAVDYSDYLIADSIGIQSYLKKEYNVESTYFPYGSYVEVNPTNHCLAKYKLKEYNYDMLIARFEPENNIEMILEAFAKSSTTQSLVLIGNFRNTTFGKVMYERYSTDGRIKFLGAIYDQKELSKLRYFSNLYFHGHSVGGTNPSLLEAMGSSCLISYHDNEFNRAIVGDDGFAFKSVKDLIQIIETTIKSEHADMVINNVEKIKNIYSWDIIIENYERYFMNILNYD